MDGSPGPLYRFGEVVVVFRRLSATFPISQKQENETIALDRANRSEERAVSAGRAVGISDIWASPI